MGRPRHTDVEVVAAVHAIRDEHGACTMAMLAAKLGMSKAGAHNRIARLVDEGLLVTSGIAGDLRPTSVPFGSEATEVGLQPELAAVPDQD